MQIRDREVCFTAGPEAEAELMDLKSVLNHLRTIYPPDIVAWDEVAKVSAI